MIQVMAKSKADSLTDKQRQFCHEYIIDYNAKRAAIAAGYSEDSAKSIACENLTKPYLKAYITKLIHERIERTDLTADYVLNELYECWNADIMQVIDFDKGCFKPIENWSPIWRKMIGGIKIKEFFEGFGMDKLKIGELVEMVAVRKREYLKMFGDHVNVAAFVSHHNHHVSGEIQINHTEREARVNRIMITALERMKSGIKPSDN